MNFTILKKMHFIYKLLSVLLVLIFLVSCSGAGIGVKDDFSNAKFKVGKTTKSDIIEYLGLPQYIVQDESGRDHYLYESGTHLVSLCIGCGNVNAGVGVIPSMISDSEARNGAEYVFDKNNVLLIKFEPGKK